MGSIDQREALKKLTQATDLLLSGGGGLGGFIDLVQDRSGETVKFRREKVAFLLSLVERQLAEAKVLVDEARQMLRQA